MNEKEDDYILLNLHLTFGGDFGLGGSYLPYAKAKLRELLKDGEDYQVRSYTPQSGVLVRIRISGDQRFVHIEATRGCTDRRGFLLSRRGQAYDALYTDGTLENINPTGGSPRPVPDPAVRTKGYRVPADLQREGLARLSASKYSGLMRLAVGCYHLAGKESPFRHEHEITHGIVKMTVRIVNQDVDKYWVAEIRQEGVFVAPIANTGKCCDSWDVVRYMPRPPSAPGDPLLPRPTKLALRTQFVAGDSRVQRIVSQAEMAAAYASGTPFYSAHGWAFSASGAEAQAVVQTFESTPAIHYACSRWKIAFEAVGENLGATLTQIEANLPATFTRNSVMWVPISSGVWEGSFGSGIEVPNPIDTYPSQDAPVAVYYVGEEAVVLRWSLTQTDVPADVQTRTFHPTQIPQPNIVTCPYGPSNQLGQSPHWDLSAITSGHNVPAYTRIDYGFYCEAFSHVDAEYSISGVTRYDLIFEDAPDSAVFPEPPNFTGIDPTCYYFDEFGVLKTSCTYQIERQAQGRIMWWWNRFDGSEASANTSSVVLFAEEREAFIGVNEQSVSQSGAKYYVNDGPDYICQSVRATKIDTTLCPFVEQITQEAGSAPCSTGMTALFPSFSSDPAFAESSETSNATLVLAELTDTATIESYNLETFLECNPTSKPTAESTVGAMHGNLYYADETLTPPDQSGNKVYYLTEQVVVGGFTAPADAVAFVGRA